MQVEQVIHKTKCDFSGCKNLAQFELKDEIDNKKKIVLCEVCLQNIGKAYLKLTTPKQPQSPFKNQKKLR